jgi:hypothetical protein
MTFVHVISGLTLKIGPQENYLKVVLVALPTRLSCTDEGPPAAGDDADAAFAIDPVSDLLSGGPSVIKRSNPKSRQAGSRAFCVAR